MRTALNFAVENEWLFKNSFVKVKGIVSTAAEVERDRVLSFEEEKKLLAACTDKRKHLKAIIICALDTAMRRKKMLKIYWKDVDLKAGEIYIKKELSKIGFDRTVGITVRLKRYLETLWEMSPKDSQMLVFGIKTDISTAFENAREVAELKDFRFHECRHTATTRMVARETPHAEVMKITGHKQLKTFLRYLNITKEAAKNCASRLDRYVAHRRKEII